MPYRTRSNLLKIFKQNKQTVTAKTNPITDIAAISKRFEHQHMNYFIYYIATTQNSNQPIAGLDIALYRHSIKASHPLILQKTFNKVVV